MMSMFFDPDFQKRARMVVSIVLAYFCSFFFLQFFFLSATPQLNPQAFEQLGQKIQSLRIDFELGSSSVEVVPSQTPAPPVEQPASFPTYSPHQPVPTMYIPPILPTQPPVVLPSKAQNIPPTQSPAKPTVPPPTQPPAPTKSTSKITYADFGKCLNNQGMVMYMTATCGLCSQQKKTLKDAANYIRIVDCNASEANGIECSKVEVRGLPTWGKNGIAVLAGPQSLEALSQETGCQTPTN